MPHYKTIMEHADDKLEDYADHISKGKDLSKLHWEEIILICEAAKGVTEAKKAKHDHEEIMEHDNPKRSRGMSV